MTSVTTETGTEDTGPLFDPRLMRSVQRLEVFVISAPAVFIVVVQAFWPLTLFAKTTSRVPGWAIAVTFVAAALLTVAELVMAWWALRVIREGRYGIGRTRLIGWSVATAPLLLVMVVPSLWPTEGVWLPNPFVLSIAMAWSVVSAAYSLAVAVIGAAALSVLGGILTSMMMTADPTSVLTGLAQGLAWSIPLGFWVGLLVLMAWSSGWMIRVIKQIDRAGRISAELAIARERLRFSRDLHDVFGRTLATVAVKSELAEGLVRRGRLEQSAGEMAAVRELADQTGREVRSLVRGYREADLGRELSGAQALLDSAGIRSEVIGDPPVLRTPETTAVAWVLREAVTNVIRHSNATCCTIRFGAAPPSVTIENDGVGESGPLGSTSSDAEPMAGHGLVNMAERFAEIGGAVEYVKADGSFRVIARLPLGTDGRNEDGVGNR